MFPAPFLEGDPPSPAPESLSMIAALHVEERGISLRFNGHYPGGPSRYRNVSILDFIGAKDDGGGGNNWSYKTCKASVTSNRYQQTNTQFCYRPDALPVTQPTASEH